MTPKAAVSALRRLPLFERVSLRLLQDLVEFASLETWWDDADSAGPRDDGDGAVHRLALLRARRPGGTVTDRRFDRDWLRAALEASFTLAHAFAGRHGELFPVLASTGRDPGCGGRDEELPAIHWLLLAKNPRFADAVAGEPDVDAGTMAALLARALARTSVGLREGAVVAMLDAHGVLLQRWQPGGPGAAVALPAAHFRPGDPPQRFPSRAFADACRELAPDDATAWHVVCVTDGDVLPAWWMDRFGACGFHRIVYLTRPQHGLRPPDAVLHHLHRGAWNPRRNDGPYFSSVVPTVLLGPRPTRRRPTVDDLRRDLPTLEVQPWEDFDRDDVGPEPRSVDARLRRDLCRIRLDLHRLAACDDDPAMRAALDRWARAVTNRQVGFALSGGGATSAALMPFLADLQSHGIPVDVVGSFSGGAILGLYLATGRLAAFADLLHRLALSVVVPAAFCSSKVIQMMINTEFGYARLDELEARFVPMTVELRGDGSPRACAVVGGTIGEGVRVSGIGLGLFGPAERRGTRYVDGGVAFGVPAAVLPDFGADMVIGCNSIVPPRGRDLNAFLPFDAGRYLALIPPVVAWWDRASDIIVGFLTMLREASRQGAEDADVYYEVSAEETPFLAAFLWSHLDSIAKAAEGQRDWIDELEQARVQWRKLRGGVSA